MTAPEPFCKAIHPSLSGRVNHQMLYKLLVDADNNTGADGTAAFTDSEAKAVLDGDRGDQLDVHVDVVAGHAHLNTLGEGDDAGNVGGTEIELRRPDP